MILALVPGPGAAQYGWAISASQTSPHENQTDPTDELSRLYLWLECTTADGLSAAEFALDPPPGVLVLEFAPRSGFLNGGTARELQLAIGGCPTGPILAGAWTLAESTPGAYCLAPGAGGGVVGTVDCDPVRPSLHPSQQVGFGLGASPTCDDGDRLCATTGTALAGWGRTKALYRD